ncbi:hypothetical protein [Botrimarina sp.]|uniref:hypothetical protein n=1 Tax=Botrimarina sp. TaxID=2795802 RepID=UPI0032ECE96E
MARLNLTAVAVALALCGGCEEKPEEPVAASQNATDSPQSATSADSASETPSAESMADSADETVAQESGPEPADSSGDAESSQGAKRFDSPDAAAAFGRDQLRKAEAARSAAAGVKAALAGWEAVREHQGHTQCDALRGELLAFLQSSPAAEAGSVGRETEDLPLKIK